MCEDGDGCRRLPLLRALGQAPPAGGLACGGGCDNCARAAREAAEARRRPAKLDLSREAVLAVRLVRGRVLTRTLALTLTLALALGLTPVLGARLLQPLTAPHCPSLPLTAPYCLSLPLTVPHCLSLPLTASHCCLATHLTRCAWRAGWGARSPSTRSRRRCEARESGAPSPTGTTYSLQP